MTGVAFAQAEEGSGEKPHFVATPSDRSVLGQAAVAQQAPVKRAGTQVGKQRVYQYRQTNGVMAFSDQPPQSRNFQVLLFDCFACRPDSQIDWRAIPLFTRSYREAIAIAARKHGLDPALIRAVIHAESAFKPGAVSKAGAQGLMQLMPATAMDMGVVDPLHPEQNIKGGSRYLAGLLKRFNGDITLACAAYNAGPSRVDEFKGIPPYPETQAYVKRVKILLQRYRMSPDA